MGFHPDRFRHFLWILYPVLLDGLTLSPTHQDLRRVADAASAFLSDAFAAVPKDSGVKAFLGTPNEHGWDVKRKLVWLGTHSFMFRPPFARYMDEQADGKVGHRAHRRLHLPGVYPMVGAGGYRHPGGSP